MVSIYLCSGQNILLVANRFNRAFYELLFQNGVSSNLKGLGSL